MTKADKIYDIAEKLGYEGDTDGSTAEAINAVSDALGFVGPHEKRITSALTDLYTVVSGGGGGGVTLGNGQYIGCTNTEPVVGQQEPEYLLTPSAALLIDDQLVTVVQLDGYHPIAAGVTADIMNNDGATACHVYSCTVDEGGKVTTLTPVTTTTSQVGWSFVIPDGGEEGLVIVWLTYP